MCFEIVFERFKISSFYCEMECTSCPAESGKLLLVINSVPSKVQKIRIAESSILIFSKLFD